MRIPVREVRFQICDTLIAFYCEPAAVNQNVQSKSKKFHIVDIKQQSSVDGTLWQQSK